jgi:nicotinamidase-related amidase
MTHLDPTRSVLLVIDVQEKLAPAMPAPALEALLRATSILLEAARVLNVRTLATEQYPRGLGPTIAPIAERLASLDVKALPKDTFSAVDDAAFLRALHAQKARHVVVVGVEAHVCVAQTVRGLCSLGFDVHVPFDGVASRRDDHKQVGLRMCERHGALVTTAESVAFDWLGRAGTDAFKAVSRAVRLAIATR